MDIKDLKLTMFSVFSFIAGFLLHFILYIVLSNYYSRVVEDFGYLKYELPISAGVLTFGFTLILIIFNAILKFSNKPFFSGIICFYVCLALYTLLIFGTCIIGIN